MGNAKADGAALVRSLEEVMRAAKSTDGHTVAELAQMTGHDDSWVRKRLHVLLRAQKLTVGRAMRPALDGTIRSVPVYRLK